LVIGGLIGVTALPRFWREPFILLVAAGVLATFSREAMLAMLVVVVAAYVGKALSTKRLVFGCFAVTALVAVLGVSYIDVDKVLTPGNIARITMTSDSSAEDRTNLAKRTFEQFEEAPLLGQGFGTTLYWGDLASHNLYLSLMADLGLIGIVIIPGLVWSVGRRSWDSYAFAAAFMLWCFFDHMVLTDSFALIALAIQADSIGGQGGREA